MRDIAAKLRENKIPCDVLHLDTGWFETDWQCDYEFSTTRFTDPKKMLADLKADGFHVSCWQLPYFVPKNKLFPELVENNLVVRDAKGNLPYEDAVLDFSNPKTVEWYQGKLANLLNEGVGAIKVDFGEAAPDNGIWANGRTGFYEHNLLSAALQQSRRRHHEANNRRQHHLGAQRVGRQPALSDSWGGDAESTDEGMAAELRGGLSFGLSGFSFWSHDVGGFTATSVEGMDKNLFARWLAFGMLSSHSRCHGIAPKEPWLYGQEFMDEFRVIDEMKYRLMPYVYAQAKDSSDHGLPMVRALFVEFPDDPGSWQVDDEYLYGSQNARRADHAQRRNRRDVYLPPGTWIDYQSGKNLFRRLAENRSRTKSRKSFWCATARSFRTSRWRKARRKWIGQKSNWPFSPRMRRRRRAWFSCRAKREAHEFTLTKIRRQLQIGQRSDGWQSELENIQAEVREMNSKINCF